LSDDSTEIIEIVDSDNASDDSDSSSDDRDNNNHTGKKNNPHFSENL
jgi:hypothetical protein